MFSWCQASSGNIMNTSPRLLIRMKKEKKKRMKKFYFICYQMDRFGMAGIASNFAARLLLQLISPRSSNTPTMEKVTAEQ